MARKNTISSRVAAVAQAADATVAVGVVQWSGHVDSVEYVADATITGAATNNRTLSLVNKGQSGVGTAVVATLILANGVNATGYDAKAITVSVTPADTVVAVGDVLAWASVHNSAGIADPGGLVKVHTRR